jgi:hypothetical protein
MTTSDIIQLCNIGATVIAVLAAPVIALWIGGILAGRTAARQQKLQLLGVLLSNRHILLSPENFKALNTIDSVFADNLEVRDAWSKYVASLNDPNLNVPTGYAVREEKRRDLMASMVKCLGLQKKITTSDLLRVYMPTAVVEAEHLAIWERIKRRADLREDFIKRGIGFPDFQPATYPVQEHIEQPGKNARTQIERNNERAAGGERIEDATPRTFQGQDSHPDNGV